MNNKERSKRPWALGMCMHEWFLCTAVNVMCVRIRLKKMIPVPYFEIPLRSLWLDEVK
jgi:hypothetical protein